MIRPAAVYPRLERASTTVQQAGVTTTVDRTGLTVTFTVGSVPWEVVAYEPYVFGSAAGVTPFLIIADGDSTTKAEAIGSTVAGASYFSAPIVCREYISTPGTYTRKARVRKVGAGSITVGGNDATYVAYIQAGPAKR